MPNLSLEAIRRELEAADQDLLTALSKRAEAIRAFQELREANPEEYFALPRDEEVRERWLSGTSAFPRGGLEAVLREVLGTSAELIAPVQVAYLGPAGSFGHLAARRRFGRTAELRVLDTVPEVFDEVVRGRVRYAMVPFETTSDGAVTATLSTLVETEVKISGELTLEASYHLYSSSGDGESIEKVYAAPPAIAACERYLRAHFGKATIVDVPSGELAAELALEDQTTAALGTEVLGDFHPLQVVRERVEDVAGVQVRFAVIGGDPPSRTGVDRTIIALAVHDEPGALYAALKPFAERHVNLTRLESRPVGSGTVRSRFFVEMDGHITDRQLLTVLEDLRSQVRDLRVLGSFPRP